MVRVWHPHSAAIDDLSSVRASRCYLMFPQHCVHVGTDVLPVKLTVALAFVIQIQGRRETATLEHFQSEHLVRRGKFVSSHTHGDVSQKFYRQKPPVFRILQSVKFVTQKLAQLIPVHVWRTDQTSLAALHVQNWSLQAKVLRRYKLQASKKYSSFHLISKQSHSQHR